MVKTKLKREQRGAVNVNPILIVALVGIAAVVGVAWYEKWGPFGQGNVHVSLGYTLLDGTEVSLTDGAQMVLFMDPQTFNWYTNSSKTTKITAVWGQLTVTPSVSEISGDVAVIWSRKHWGVLGTTPGSEPNAYDSDGTSISATVPQNISTTISASKCTVSLTTPTPLPNGQYIWVWKYDVTATIGTATATASAQGTIVAYNSNGTLTITGSVGTGSLNLVK
jgi:hypothetical protein